MKDGQLFRVKFIKDESDLPKEAGEYFAYRKSDNRLLVFNRFMEKDLEFETSVWMRNANWYLIPDETTDTDIEAWAEDLFLHQTDDISKSKIVCSIMGAKAVLNGEIKHVEK